MSKPPPTFPELAAEYTALWNAATVNADKLDVVKGLATTIQGNKARYDAVSGQTGPRDQQVLKRLLSRAAADVKARSS